jgi:hypothetical protein
VIDFETYHEVRRLQRELNLTPSQISAQTGLNIRPSANGWTKPATSRVAKEPGAPANSIPTRI